MGNGDAAWSGTIPTQPHGQDEAPMDKVIQALFQAEFRKFVLHDDAALDSLDNTLMALFKAHHLRLDIPAIQRRVRTLRDLDSRPPLDTQYLAAFGVRGVVRDPLP